MSRYRGPRLKKIHRLGALPRLTRKTPKSGSNPKKRKTPKSGSNPKKVNRSGFTKIT